MVEIAEVSIKNLQNLIKYTLKELNNISNKILNNANSEIRFVENYVSAKLANAIKEINELAEQATSHGLDSTVCVGNNLDILNEIVEKVVVEINTCQSEQLGVCNVTLTAAIGAVKTLSKDVTELKQDFIDCGSGIAAIPCANKIVLRAQTKQAELSIAFNSIIAGVMEELSESVAETTNCTYHPFNEGTEKILRIRIEVSNCLKTAMETLPKSKN